MRKLVSLHVMRHPSTKPSCATSRSRERARKTAPHAPGARSSSPRSCAGPRPGPRRPPWAHRRSAPAARRRLPARRRAPSPGPRAAAGGPWRTAATQASVGVSAGLGSRWGEGVWGRVFYCRRPVADSCRASQPKCRLHRARVWWGKGVVVEWHLQAACSKTGGIVLPNPTR